MRAGRAVVHDEDAGAAEGAEARGLPLLPGIAERRRAPAQQRLDAQDDQVLLGGFRHVGVRAALQSLALDARSRASVSMMTGIARVRTLRRICRGQLVAVHAGQMVIGDDEVGQLLVQAVEGGFRGGAPGRR